MALLYRAQVQALKDQLVLQARHSAEQLALVAQYAAERDSAASYWRDKYLETDRRLDKRFETLDRATALVRTVPKQQQQ